MTKPPGIALIVTVLLLAVLAAVGAGIFTLGVRETEIAAAMVRRSAATAAAESAVRGAVDGWSTRHYRSLVTGQSMPAALADDPVARQGESGESGESGTAIMETSVVITRLDDRLFLVEGSAHSRVGPRAVARAGILVRTLDPDAIARAFPAAVAAEAAAVIEAGQVSSAAPDGSVATPCDHTSPAPAVLAPYITIDPAAAVGEPGAVIGEPPPIPGPDPFLPPLLPHVVSLAVPGGTVTPGPWSGPGGCEPHPSNWGAVSPSNDCHGLVPFVWSDTDLTVRAGEGRGLLLVDGDLHIDGFRFDGVILVRGALTITGSTVIRGALRAHSVHITGGMLTHDPCAIRAALAAGGLDRAFRPSDRWWVPAF